MVDEKHIEALAAVVSEGSFQGAARRLRLTPAAVTQRIKALESEVGTLVVVRGKHLRLTPQGQALLAYQQKSELLQQELLRALNLDAQTYRGNKRWRTLRVAVNADSLATWFLPGVVTVLKEQHLLLDVVIDDQDYTHEALRAGEVMGCVTTLSEPMSGCLAEPLGVMRYRCMANAGLLEQIHTSAGKLSVHRLLTQPAVIFNRKDALQERFLELHFDLKAPSYPKHFVPALDAFEAAIRLGMGWGMVPDVPAGRLDDGSGELHGEFCGELREVWSGSYVDVALYWQHWEKEPAHAAALTQAVKAAAQRVLM